MQIQWMLDLKSGPLYKPLHYILVAVVLSQTHVYVGEKSLAAVLLFELRVMQPRLFKNRSGVKECHDRAVSCLGALNCLSDVVVQFFAVDEIGDLRLLQ